MIQDEYTGLIYEQQIIKKQSLVDQENTGIDTDLLTPNEVNNLVIIDKIKMERDLWKSSYLSLYNAMKEKEKIEKLIKSML